jgi:general secretion pathway protein M
LSASRNRSLALAALLGLIVVGAGVPMLALSARSEALQELSDVKDAYARVMAAQSSGKGKSGARPEKAEAPPEAFLSAQTPGLAAAQLEAYLASVTSSLRASLNSSNAQQTDRSDPPDVVHVRANIDVDYKALQPLLYRLESGTPYIFIDSLTLRPANASSRRDANTLPMRATLDVRALWRQGQP